VASEVAGFKKNNDFILIINDHADIACQVGADGVHVGTNDMPVTEIRKTFGDEIMIGFSSHSAEEAKKAWEMGADYVAFGAIFPTKTKGPGHPVQGLEKLREVVAAASIPVVAIGGICRENIEGVLKTGVSSVAMISALALANDPVLEAISYGRLIRRFLGASR
jgi:thiamine-phosphate pyrophosphorylase